MIDVCDGTAIHVMRVCSSPDKGIAVSQNPLVKGTEDVGSSLQVLCLTRSMLQTTKRLAQVANVTWGPKRPRILATKHGLQT